MDKPGVGLIVLGSQKEKHGLLPEDTDSKLALYVAFKSSLISESKVVGIVNSAAELSYLKHGRYHHPSIVLRDIETVIQNAVERLGTTSFVIVNGHGGNKIVKDYLTEVRDRLKVEIEFNNRIIELEGAHAASKECSMAASAGLSEPGSLKEQDNFKKYPEVGFVGFTDAHVNPVLKGLAKKTLEEGVYVDLKLGEDLLDHAVQDVVRAVKKLQDVEKAQSKKQKDVSP